MRYKLHSGQFEPDAPFEPPAPIAEGSDEARFASHRARFAGMKFDLAEFNRIIGFAAFKRWHKRELDARDAATGDKPEESAMNRIVFLLLLATAWLDAHAQSSLPQCQGATAVWNQCYGEIKFSDGESYRGGFRNGKPHGKGVYTWSDGQRYQGEFLNGDFHGKGTWTWPDGR